MQKAAAIWILGLASIGAVFLQPNQETLEKLYHFVPEIGIIEQVAGKVYDQEVKRVDMVHEYGVTAELKEIV